MRRALCLSLLLAAVSWAGPVPAASPSLNVEQNRSLIRLDIHLDSALPSGSMVVCKAELIPEARPPAENRRLLVPIGAIAILQGASGDCRLEIPLCWTGNDMPSGVTLHYEIDAETSSGAPPVTLRRGILRVPAGNAAAYSTLSLGLGSVP